eukprot:364938-Chlamydomonas_euryale.AAC.12
MAPYMKNVARAAALHVQVLHPLFRLLNVLGNHLLQAAAPFFQAIHSRSALTYAWLQKLTNSTDVRTRWVFCLRLLLACICEPRCAVHVRTTPAQCTTPCWFGHLLLPAVHVVHRWMVADACIPPRRSGAVLLAISLLNVSVGALMYKAVTGATWHAALFTVYR